MNRFEKYFFGAAVLLSLTAAGCTKDPGVDGDGSKVPIVLRAAVTGGATAQTAGVKGASQSATAGASQSGAAGVHARQSGTRAAVDGTSSMTLYFLRADETSSGTYGGYGAAALDAVRAAGADAQALTFALEQYYPAGGLKTKLVGWTPAATLTGGTASWTLDGSQDVMTASVQEGSATSVLPSFAFRHALAQIRFYLYAESAGIPAQWGKITAIKVGKQRTACAFTPSSDEATGKVAFSGEPTAAFGVQNLTAAEVPVGLANATQFGDPVMIEPQTNGYYVRVTVSTEKLGDISTLAPLQFYPQESVTRLMLKFTANAYSIDPVQTDITDWVTTGGGSADVGGSKTYPYVVDGSIVVTRDFKGWAGGVRFHDNWTTTPAHNETDAANSVAWRFEVAAENCNATNAPGVTPDLLSSDMYFGPNSAAACAAYSQPSGAAGTWRLPTIDELEMVINLKENYSFSFPATHYTAWSATDISTRSGYRFTYVIGSSGELYRNEYEYLSTRFGCYIRCVRDLPALVPDPVVGDLRNGGVIFWVDPTDITHYKVAAMDDAGGASATYQWASLTSYVIGTSSNSVPDQNNIYVTSGKACYDKAVEYAEANRRVYMFDTDFPAFNACLTYDSGDGGRWFLPSGGELRALYEADKILTASGAATLINGNPYWSGTEHTTYTGLAWYLNSNDSAIQWPKTKTYTYHVRCVREFPEPLAIGSLRDGGVVFWVDPDNSDHYKVVMLDADAGRHDWAADNTYVTGASASSATDLTNIYVTSGKACYDKAVEYAAANNLTDFAAAFPAFNACAAYNSGDGAGKWYLPAVWELNSFYDVLDAISVLGRPIGWSYSHSYSDYWSATEYSTDSTTAWVVGMGGGAPGVINYHKKDSSDSIITRYVRCIRDVTL